MNILYLNHNVVWKSAFHRCFQFGKRLAALGHKVTIVTNDPKSRFFFSRYAKFGISIILSPDILWGQLRTGWDPINAIRRIIYLRKTEFDIIHAFDSRPTVIIPALYLKRKLKIPLVIDWGDWWGRGGAINLRHPRWLNKLFEPVEVFFEEYFKKFANHITVVSRPLMNRARHLLGPQMPISLIPNGSDTESIRPIDKKLARKQLNLDVDEYIAIFAGFVTYDIRLIIQAVKDLASEKFPVKLLIVGTDEKFIVNNNIISAGKIEFSKLPYYFAAADIALMPLSDNIANMARYPMKFGDYLSAGKPIVTSNVGDIGQLVIDKKLGIACQPTTKSYKAAIKYLLNNPGLRKKCPVIAYYLPEASTTTMIELGSLSRSTIAYAAFDNRSSPL